MRTLELDTKAETPVREAVPIPNLRRSCLTITNHCHFHPVPQRETQILQKYPAIVIIGIGWPPKDGYPHENRAADYDDWVTDTRSETGKDTHGLNGDILVWNHVTHRRHELSTMGIRVNADPLRKQLEMADLLHNLKLP